MSIESRLTALQSKVEEILTVAKNGNSRRLWKDEDPWSMDNYLSPEPGLLSPQQEIRTLELWRSVVAECLGTLCFVFFVCGVSIPWTGHFPPFLSVAFATALAYGALTFRVFPRAHLNPAFTLALTAIKRVTPLRCVLFLTAQSGGAIAGAALLFGLTVPGYQGTLGATTIASHISSYQAFGLELILSFVIALTFVSDPHNCFPTSAMILAANLVALPCTGAGLNPVRSLGPAFVMNRWPSHWVFWLGPILGGLMAAYLHTFILRRGHGNKKVRENPSDGDSLDLPSTELPTTIPDRLLCQRFEPIYGGTRSLYMKPSPVLPKTNLNRSQSVYASKRYDFPPAPKFHDTSAPSSVTNRKSTNNHSQSHCQRHYDPDSNYEPLYDRKPPAGAGQALLVSGPPSYESNFFKNYDTAKSNLSTSSQHPHQHSTSSSQNHHNPNHHHHHHREKSDSLQQQRERERENQTNRILAQYETAKGSVDVDPKAAMKGNKSLYYETNEGRKQQVESLEKKLIDTVSSGESDNSGNPPPPPRFRYSGNQQPMSQPESRGKYSSGQYHPVPPIPPGFGPNDLSRCGSIGKGGGQNEAKKPYEILDSKKLLEFSSSNNCGQQQQSNYSPRLLMAEKDSTYSRILEPLLNSKRPSHFVVQAPQQQQQQQQQQQLLLQQQQQQLLQQQQQQLLQQQQQEQLLQQQGNQQQIRPNHHGPACPMSPSADLTYSYH
ncbi:unnamed protein product [Allacma fusca]|uniref:Neurogenic protein big brain n=1 Tax=Allacma fusca TaxID=39272 RepID=A0A8J2KHR1_9HEXA|nr:unnamed protein product [Allacma fusca]